MRESIASGSIEAPGIACKPRPLARSILRVVHCSGNVNPQKSFLYPSFCRTRSSPAPKCGGRDLLSKLFVYFHFAGWYTCSLLIRWECVATLGASWAESQLANADHTSQQNGDDTAMTMHLLNNVAHVDTPLFHSNL